MPNPTRLSDQDAYLVQQQRILLHRLQELYHRSDNFGTGMSLKQTGIHLALPQTKNVLKQFIPEDLSGDSVDYQASGMNKKGSRVLQPRSLDKTMKILEAREKKLSGADKAGDKVGHIVY